MYRILGITQDNRMKLIKNEAITRGGYNNTGIHVWHSASEKDDCTGTNCDWAHSTLYNDLNSTYYLTNSYYVDSANNWDDKILSVNWKYGDLKSRKEFVAADEFIIENAFASTINTKIGLMYMYDYYYANNWDGNQELVNGNKYNNNGWIHITHGGNHPNNYEWILSRYGLENNGCYAWLVSSGGYVDPSRLNNTHSIRPVFYLTNEITLTGTGTSTDPYIIGAPAVS